MGAVFAATGDPTIPILVTIVVTLVVLALLAMVWSFVRTLGMVRAAADELRRQNVELLQEMRDALGSASTELQRADGLLGTAESISATVDSASRLAYETIANPIVKVLAFGTGTRTAARRLRRGTRRG